MKVVVVRFGQGNTPLNRNRRLVVEHSIELVRGRIAVLGPGFFQKKWDGFRSHLSYRNFGFTKIWRAELLKPETQWLSARNRFTGTKRVGQEDRHYDCPDNGYGKDSALLHSRMNVFFSVFSVSREVIRCGSPKRKSK